MDLIGKKLKDSYKGLLNLAGNNQVLDSTLRAVTDGQGNNSPLRLSTGSVGFNFGFGNTVIKNWSSNFTGLYADSSYATTQFNIAWATSGSELLLKGLTNLGRVVTFIDNSAIIDTSSVGVSIGAGSNIASARLQVRGDGTNPIAIFEKSNQTSLLQITEDSLVLGGNSITIATANLHDPLTIRAAANSPYFLVTSGFNQDWPSSQHIFTGSNQIFNVATQTNNPAGLMMINGTIGISNAAASTFDYLMLRLEYTINNTATSTTTANGIYLNATETNLNGQTHNLLNLQVNNVSKFKVLNNGAISVASINDADAPNSTLYFSNNSNKLVWKDSGGTVNDLY